ncbi:MAG: O-antigen ligase family protein [Candidatus Dormibacteraeota bacterium]|nr:O-antigen ligase family protein [Candidatus Dormibacteraeota bacterium]
MTPSAEAPVPAALRSEPVPANRVQIAGTLLFGLGLTLSPAYVVRLHLDRFPLTVLEVALVVALVVGYIGYWRELPWRNPYLIPGVLLLVAALISIAVSPLRLSAANTWLAYFVEPAAAGLLAAAVCRRRAHARVLLLGLGVAGAVISVANLGNTLHAIATHQFDEVTPPVVIYTSANAISLYLEPLLAFAFGIVVFSDDRRERWAAGAFAVLFVLADLFSFSRLGWITLACLIVFVAAFTRFRWWSWAALMAAGAAAFALSSSVRRRVLVEFSSSSDNTILLRKPLWHSALNMLWHRPLQGGGLDGFQRTVRMYAVDGYNENLIYPHNLFLNFWSEAGLLGLVAIVWYGVQLVRSGVRGVLRQNSPWVRALSLGVLGLVLTFLVHGVGDVPYFKNDQTLAFWTLAGIQLGALGISADHRPRRHLVGDRQNSLQDRQGDLVVEV